MNTVTVYNEKEYYLDQLVKYENHYRRVIGVDDMVNCNNDLIGYIKLLTNDNYFYKHIDDYILVEESHGTICICGCKRCETLFIVKHIPSNIDFAVGSSCIKKFFKNLSGNIKKIRNNELCNQCNTPLYYRTTKYHVKNAYKDKNKNNAHLGHCILCWNS